MFGDDGNDLVWGGFPFRNASFFDLTVASNFESPPGFDAAEADPITTSGYVLPNNGMSPKILIGLSVDGQLLDGADNINGGAGDDFLFGGSDNDVIDGGSGHDYADGGLGDDLVMGGDGNDTVRGGFGNDELHGGAGIDQLYGDQGSDYLFGEAGTPDHSQAGQRLWGGDGIDYLYAHAEIGLPTSVIVGGVPTSVDIDHVSAGLGVAVANAIATETARRGDEMHGGADGDFIYGNLRRDIAFGDGGNDYIHGEYSAGPRLVRNILADLVGGADVLYGGSGQDQIYGGGGNDFLWGGADTDWLEGQNGNDTLYGGGGIDLMILDVSPLFTILGDRFDGHYGNQQFDDVHDDNATDIMLIQATNADDVIRLGEQDATINLPNPNGTTTATVVNGALHVDIAVRGQPFREILAPWRAPDGTPLVEQFRVSALGGADDVSFTIRQPRSTPRAACASSTSAA